MDESGSILINSTGRISTVKEKAITALDEIKPGLIQLFGSYAWIGHETGKFYDKKEKEVSEYTVPELAQFELMHRDI